MPFTRRCAWAALVSAVLFALVAGASAVGAFRAVDEWLLRGLLSVRSCTLVAISSLASTVAAIETAIGLTVLVAGALLLAGVGPRALWVGAWVLSLPIELVLKLRFAHPLPPNVVGWQLPQCEGTNPLTNPYLSPWTSPTQSVLLNPEGDVVQPLLQVGIGHTFPSGYTARLAFCAVLLGLWLWPRVPARIRSEGVAAALTLVVLLASTRLLLVWHWPSDILGGLLLGTTTACVARVGWELTPRHWWPAWEGWRYRRAGPR